MATGVRSPADVLRLVVAAVLLVVLLIVSAVFGDTLVGFTADLLSGLSALPDWIAVVLVVGTRLLALAAVAGGLLWTAFKHRWAATITIAVAAALAGVLVPLLDGVADVDSAAAVLVPETGVGALTRGWFPSAAGIAMLAAGLTAAAPWLGRRWRRIGWLAVLGLALIRLLTSPMDFDTLRAVLIGWVAGAASLVVLGAPSRRPTADSISAGLASVGLPLATLEPAKVDARGSTPYFATGTDGGPLFVKALGRDERSADLLFRVYRWAQRHDLGDERPFSSLRRAIEHEALVALAARDLGVITPRLRAVARAEPDSFVLAYDAVAGKSFDRLDPSALSDDTLTAIWQRLADLRHHRIAHRDLRLANLFLGEDGLVWIIDFGFSELAASDLLLANDVAELVASSSVAVGVERAVAPARLTVDAATLERAATRLRPWALSGATRAALKERPGHLDALRRALGPT